MDIQIAKEGFDAICRLAGSRGVDNHSLSRRLADEAEVIRLYRAAVYGGDGRQSDLTNPQPLPLEPKGHPRRAAFIANIVGKRDQ